jgi:hypothetical protein
MPTRHNQACAFLIYVSVGHKGKGNTGFKHGLTGLRLVMVQAKESVYAIADLWDGI